MRAIGRACLAVAITALPAEAQLVRNWHAVRTPHFELVSRYDPAVLQPLLVDLEWAWLVFEKQLGLNTRAGRQVLIFIPDAIYDFEQWAPAGSAGGFYKAAPWRDLIVLRELPQARHALLHEFTHLALRHQGGAWPLWYNEGTAELFAELRRTEKGAEIGRPDPQRIAVLGRLPWLPVSYVMEIENASRLTASESQRFYAQAWLYLHMLRLSPAYRGGFERFRALMADNRPAEEALKSVYAKSIAQFDEDARQWYRQRRYPVDYIESPSAPVPQARVEVLADMDVELAKAAIAGAGSVKVTAEAGYRRLAQMAGDECRHQAALGDVAYASGLLAEAGRHYQRAVQCGADVSTLAQGLETALVHRGDRLPVKEIEAVAALTGGLRSRYLLGTAHFFAEEYEAAVRVFPDPAELPEAEGFRVRRLKALALARLGRRAEARAEVERLLAFAANDEQRQSAQITLQDVNRERMEAEAPQPVFHEIQLRSLSRLDGEVIRVDCMGERARFWVRAGSRTRKLMIEAGDIITGGEDAPQLEFACGEQKRPVTVGYMEQPDAATETEGRIKYLRYR